MYKVKLKFKLFGLQSHLFIRFKLTLNSRGYRYHGHCRYKRYYLKKTPNTIVRCFNTHNMKILLI